MAPVEGRKRPVSNSAGLSREDVSSEPTGPKSSSRTSSKSELGASESSARLEGFRREGLPTAAMLALARDPCTRAYLRHGRQCLDYTRVAVKVASTGACRVEQGFQWSAVCGLRTLRPG